MKYFIITGTSRGLGEALANQLAAPHHSLFCISRTRNERLIEQVTEKGAHIGYFEYDLSNPEQIEGLFGDIFEKIDTEQSEMISLINNAGIVRPMKPIEKCSTEEVTNNLQVNLIAPMLLTLAFVKHTLNIATEKRILNISSGAGKNPYFGWSIYCSSKAGLDMFTRCVGVEQTERTYPVKVLSLAPGVVDTEMQSEIRGASKEDFIHLDRFVQLKKEGQLLSPSFVAEKIRDILLAEQYEQGGVLDIRNLL